MPLFTYRCRACDLIEDRLCGIDDRTLLCTECGEIMDRQISDQEALHCYFHEHEAGERKAEPGAG